MNNSRSASEPVVSESAHAVSPQSGKVETFTALLKPDDRIKASCARIESVWLCCLTSLASQTMDCV